MNTLNTTQIWNDFAQNLHQYIIRKVHYQDIAQDISQEIFIKLHQNLSKLKEEQKVTAWLFRIAHHQIMDYYRQQTKKVVLNSRQLEQQQESEKDVTKDLAACMNRMIDALPPKYREAVRLADIEGMSQKDLAERLGISYSGAKSRVQRGRAALKVLFLECCTVEHDRYGNIIDFKKREAADCVKCI